MGISDIIAGFIHSSVVLRAGLPLEGVNLYNNGFSAGFVAIFLYPLIISFIPNKKPEILDKEFLDTFEETEEIALDEIPVPIAQELEGEELERDLE